MFITPGIQTKINATALPAYMYVRPDHRVVIRKTAEGTAQKVVLGAFLPLSEVAATKYARRLGNSREYGVMTRSKAVKAGLIKF